MRFTVDTAQMPAWTGEEEAPDGVYSWGTYTELGPFRPPRLVHVGAEQRREYSGAHHARGGRNWRDLGDILWGAFLPI